jgi:hypothetical protein
MTRFMFRYVKNNFQESFQPYFLYVLGKVRVGAFRENTYPDFRPKPDNKSINILQLPQVL